MAQPDLKFALKKPTSTNIDWLELQNVVAHITFANSHTRTDRVFFGTPPPPQKRGIKDPNRLGQPPPLVRAPPIHLVLFHKQGFLFFRGCLLPLLERPQHICSSSTNACSSIEHTPARMRSPFMHKRHDCGAHGKFLQFESDNSIRAGKRSHADAVHSVYRWRKFIGNPKIKSITTPNLVASGQFKHNIDTDALKKLPTANYSKKFPGTSNPFIPFHCHNALLLSQPKTHIQSIHPLSLS